MKTAVGIFLAILQGLFNENSSYRWAVIEVIEML